MTLKKSKRKLKVEHKKLKMLESNARLLAARFPVVLDRILKAGERISDSFFYESDGGKEILSLQRGEHSFPVYGKNRRPDPEKMV